MENMNIPLVKVPTYKMTLPYDNKEVKYRPYLVKEEKLLILAKDSGDVELMADTVIDIVKSCTFNELDAETAPMFDVQYAFLQIRSKAMGESIDLTAKCTECAGETNIRLKTDDFILKTTEGHNTKIELDSNFHVVMKYPTIKDFLDLYNNKSDDMTYDIIAKCIDIIYTDEEVYKNGPNKTSEFRKFLDNLTVVQFEKIESFFTSMPVIHKSINYQCSKCNADNMTFIDGITNFFA